MRIRLILAAGLAAGLAACGSSDDTDTATMPADIDPALETAAMGSATALLRMADGIAAGTATASATPNGIAIMLDAVGLEPGEHGVHVHAVGSCEAPDFTSAGGHWNPMDTAHGLDGDDGQHAGDMPNLAVGEDGAGALQYTLMGGTFADLIDDDGAAFVVHEGSDDQMTDPSGNSGSRVACGVFTADPSAV